MKYKVKDARFLVTAVEPKGYPAPDRPEIAFVGRSNVGKSSMINTLTGRKKLVRVSNTPGRTKTLNFFDVDLALGSKELGLRLADLPGYGFAKASKAERATWDKMITTYLEKRDGLKVVVSIIDAEIGPTPDDMQMLDFLQERAPRVLVVATKIDRLVKSKQKPRRFALAEQLEVPPEVVVLFSAEDRTGVDEAWFSLLGVL